MCARCDAESADYAAKAQAAYAANGWRLHAALTHEDELVEKVERRIYSTQGGETETDLARAVIDIVRAFDERTALMRDAKDDHTAQNNEGQDHAY